MKKTIFICIMTLCFTCVYSQNQNVDSLIYVLETEKMPTENKMRLYWDILLCYWNTDLEKNIIYAKEALNYANKENDDSWISRFNRALGMSYYFKGEYDLSLIALENAVKYAIKAKNKREENASNIQIGNMYFKAGKEELALKYYTDALSSLDSLEQYIDYANSLINISTIHSRHFNIEKAKYYINIALKTAEEQNLMQPKMSCYSNLGSIYNDEGLLDSALVFIHKSYEIGHILNQKINIIISTQMLAGIYSDLGDLKNAEKYAQECLDTANEYGGKQEILTAWIIMAKVNFALKRYKDCEMYASKTWEADSMDIENADNAIHYLCSSNIFLGNKEKAFYYLQKYKDIRDEKSGKSLHNSIADMEIKYETEKKEIRIASLEKERQMYIWLGVAGALLAIALSVALWLRIRSARKEKQLVATQSVLDGEMGERSRLARDLHDRLSGNLSAVKMGIKDNRESILSIQDKLDKCIDEVRRIAHNLMPASLQFGLKVALGDFAAQYDNVNFHFFGEEKRAEDRIEFVVYCCASELVNNSLRHSGANNINLQLIQSDKHISITVQDDGCGFDENSVKKGFGMKSINDRIASCNGKIDVSSSPGNGTETTIELKIENTD